ncbi:MAG: bifunctional 3-deoxy-7-phosphoheptulonate synthase/chorismate mutase [bacterium]
MVRSKKKDLQSLRSTINKIDTDILKLLAERRSLSGKVIEAKDATEKPLRDQSREEDLLRQVIKMGKEKGLDAYFVKKVFYEIIDDSLRIQQDYLQKKVNRDLLAGQVLRIAIQGITGSYSYLAAREFFSNVEARLSFVGKERFEEVVQSVEHGEADYAMLPIENTTSGGINEVYDQLLHTTLSIVGEEKYHVNHCLAGVKEVPIGKIKKIFAHHQAAAQCSRFLVTLTGCQVEYVYDTAMSVKKIMDERNPAHAAIASEDAAGFFKARILRKNIANQTENYTRFLIGSRKPIEVDLRIPCKTSLVMATSQEPGSLVSALMVLKKYNINMTKLESRPILGNPWEEMFYLDFEGNMADSVVLKMLDEFGRFTRFLKILGSYPSRDLPRTKVDAIAPSPQIEVKPIQVKIAEQAAHPTPQHSGKSKNYKLASREYKSDDTVIKVRDVEIGGNNFVVIAGPCSVESHTQIMQCAQQVREHGGQILRGGCFKPRTSPYAFQGMGYEGLDLLVAAGKAYELPTITEVLAVDQITEVASKADILQIGARNMQNFSLLKEVGKVHKPIMLKRGLMASIEELLNAAEYILAQGNRQVILCERGIRTFETATRNTLDLSAIPVLRELTHLPIIVDPSHAIGQRDKVIPLAKAAKVVGAHGIMIEFHPDPPKALSDGEQSLWFSQFEQLMIELRNLH